MSRDLQLSLGLTVAHAPTPDKADVDALHVLLRGRGWMRAATIGAELGSRWTERFVRAVAAASAGRVLSFPGSPGYRLTREASLEEIRKAVQTLRSQGAAMLQRSVAIDQLARKMSFPDVEPVTPQPEIL